MINILNITNNIDYGGIESYLLGIAQNIDRKKYVYDFLTGSVYETEMMRKLRGTGSKVILISRRRKFIRHVVEMLWFLWKNRRKYDIIHVHIIQKSYLPCFIAMLCGYKIRVSHSHTSFIGQKIPLKMRGECELTKKVSTDYAGCSRRANEFLFGKDKRCFVAKIGIDYKRFYFDSEKRNMYRKKMGLFNECAMCLIGRLEIEKNHIFICNIARQLQGLSYKLYFAGEGVQRQNLENYIEENELKDKIVLLGNRDDIPDLLNAFDILLLPSIHEGFPVTLVEAQVNGLPCIVSDRVTRETKITDDISYVALENEGEWINQIKIYATKSRTRAFAGSMDYEVKKCAKELEEYYDSIMKG